MQTLVASSVAKSPESTKRNASFPNMCPLYYQPFIQTTLSREATGSLRWLSHGLCTLTVSWVDTHLPAALQTTGKFLDSLCPKCFGGAGIILKFIFIFSQHTDIPPGSSRSVFTLQYLYLKYLKGYSKQRKR